VADKQEIQQIKKDIERTIQGLSTKSKEFTFEQTGGFVREDTIYSIYFTLNKEKIYLTGIMSSNNSKIIEKVDEDSLFVKYSNLKSTIRIPYPNTTPVKPSESDYRIGNIRRYFAQSANDSTKPIFEISEQDFNNKNNLFKYIDIRWVISGLQNEVKRDNQVTLNFLEKQFKGISKQISPLQLFRPKKNSGEDTRKKLSLLRKT